MIFRLLQLCLRGCPHTHSYRERRELHGVDVLHLVCEHCGRAVPALQRSAEEHREVVHAGAIKPLHARRVPTAVIDLNVRRGHTPRRVAS